MIKFFIPLGDYLHSYFEQTMEYLNLKYHAYPSNIPDTPIRDVDRVDMSYYESMADYASGMRSYYADDSERSHMVVDRDPNYCNGLYRNK